MKSDEARFSKKNPVRLKMAKNGLKWPKNEVFAIFLKNDSNDFAYIAYLVKGDDSWSFCQNCIFKKFWFSSYCPKCLSANQIARFLKIKYLKNRLSVRADFLFGNSESWKEHDTNIFLWQDTLGACLGMPIPVLIVTHGANLRQNVLAKNGHFWGGFKFWQKSSPLMCTYYCWKWKYLWCCNFLQKPHVWEKSCFRMN